MLIATPSLKRVVHRREPRDAWFFGVIGVIFCALGAFMHWAIACEMTQRERAAPTSIAPTSTTIAHPAPVDGFESATCDPRKQNDTCGEVHMRTGRAMRAFDYTWDFAPRCVCTHAECTATATELTIVADKGADVVYMCIGSAAGPVPAGNAAGSYSISATGLSASPSGSITSAPIAAYAHNLIPIASPMTLADSAITDDGSTVTLGAGTVTLRNLTISDGKGNTLVSCPLATDGKSYERCTVTKPTR